MVDTQAVSAENIELVQVVLGPQWGLAVGLVPWFALAGGCNVASQLTQLLADARAELNRSLAVQTAYILGLALLILLALPFRLVGITLEGVFRLLAAIILLPARLLRGPRGARA